MNRRHRLVAAALVVGSILAVAPGSAHAEKRSRARAKRAEIDAMASETLERLFSKSRKSKELYARAYGYAVFDNLKISLGLTGGGGAGVAVHKASGRRIYMKMGTAGLNLGLGGQKYQVVFLFQDSKTFNSFVDKGWQADASASAVAGKAGVNAETTFTNGLAIFQLTEGGLMLQADISGTKYWKYKKLNQN
ncbi:MAG: YSC84-related protein [Acidobacteriota bacterium]